jgi:hypothetical protein
MRLTTRKNKGPVKLEHKDCQGQVKLDIIKFHIESLVCGKASELHTALAQFAAAQFPTPALRSLTPPPFSHPRSLYSTALISTQPQHFQLILIGVRMFDRLPAGDLPCVEDPLLGDIMEITTPEDVKSYYGAHLRRHIALCILPS